jgi:hypothetical protein
MSTSFGFLTGMCALGGALACARVYTMQAALERAEWRARSERRRRQRRQQHGRGSSNATLARVSSAAARRTAQIVTDKISSSLLAAGCAADDWEAAFAHMDRHGNGDLTRKEFRSGLLSLTGTRLSATDIDELMFEIDSDGDGRVNYFEFIAALERAEEARGLAADVTDDLRRALTHDGEGLMHAFATMDTNGKRDIRGRFSLGSRAYYYCARAPRADMGGPHFR